MKDLKYLMTFEAFEEFHTLWIENWKKLQKHDPTVYNQLKNKLGFSDDEIFDDNIKILSYGPLLPDIIMAAKKAEEKEPPKEEYI